jgi:L-ascorbate metabolism protein UlaG (beta-lactamase superfamily)
MALFSLLVLAAAAWHFRWFRPASNWQEATGFALLPESMRPAAAPMGPAGPQSLHWLGHSGFLLSWAGQRLLVDPHAGDWVTFSRRAQRPPAPPATWGEIDAALITHAHRDHLHPATLAAVPRLRQVILPVGAEAYLPALPGSIPRLPARAHQVIALGELDIIPVPAAHNGSRHHPWRGGPAALGYVIRRGGGALYHAGDTAFSLDFEAIRERYHPRWAVLPIGAFAPRFPLRIHHFSPEEAVQAGRRLGVESVWPCHFGTFTLSLDRPSTALPRFARAAQAAGLAWGLPPFLSSSARP